MAPTSIPEGLAAVMRREIASTFTSAYAVQGELRSGQDAVIDTLTYLTRGRFSADEVSALLVSSSEIAHPHPRAREAAAVVEFHDAGECHGWQSYRAAAIAPTDGATALAVSWRFTSPYRDTVVTEVDNLWSHRVGGPLVLPDPLPERVPIVVGDAPLSIGPDITLWMRDGVFDSASIDHFLKERTVSEGGVELLTTTEIALLQRVMRALVDGDRSVLDEVDAYAHGGDPYLWTRDYGAFGDVHLVMPPGAVADWSVGVVQVDDLPGVSFLTVEMWTREEGRSDLSLEIEFSTDASTGEVRAEFGGLHVM